MVIAGEIPASVHICKLITLRPRDLKKFFPAGRLGDTVTHDHSQVPGRRRMYSALITGVKAIRRHKMRIIAAKLLCFLVHKSGKFLHRAGNPFRDHHRAVVMGFQHQRIQEVAQIELLLILNPKPYLGLAGRIGRRSNDLVLLPVLQCKDTGHDLGRARHRPNLFLFFAK